MLRIGLEQRIEKLVLVVEDLIGQTQEIYENIYQQLPDIEREIELTIQEMDILLDYFLSPGDEQLSAADSEEINKLSSVLQDISNNISKTEAEMVDEHSIRQAINSLLVDKEDQNQQINIEQLINKLIEIKERITDVELIAMNAMIYAANIEGGGDGFSVVADNIKEIATELKGFYTEMQTTTNQLQNWNFEFVESLEKLLECHQQLSTEQISDFKDIISVVFESLAVINELLENLIKNIKLTVEPIQDLMISIQAQDLVEQNLEFMGNCLLSIQELDVKFEEEYELDFLLFASKFLDLAVDSIGIVQDKLDDSLNKLGVFLDKIKDDTDSLRRDGELITDFLGGDQEKSTYNSIEEIFDEVKSFIEQFYKDLLKLNTEIKDMSVFDQSFNSLIVEIEEWVSLIKVKVDFLQKLKLLSKIELARLEVGNKNFGQEISQISAEIADEVAVNEELIAELKHRLEIDLEQFKEVLEINQSAINNMSNRISTCHEELSIVESLISEAIAAIKSSTDRLFTEIDQITGKLIGAQSLLNRLGGIEEELLELKAEYDTQLSQLTAGSAAKESLEVVELQELLTQFKEKQISINSSKNYDFNDSDEDDSLVLF